MNTKGHPVAWQGKTYHLSDVTAGVKDDYCAWLFRVMIMNAARRMETVDFVNYQNCLTAAPPEWTAIPDQCVVLSLMKADGRRQLNRILFGLTLEEMPDERLDALVKEKEATKPNDYTIAMDLIKEASDPKPQPGEPSSTSNPAAPENAG